MVTLVISFTFPVIFVLGLLTIALGVSYFPGLESIGEVGLNQLLSFLRIFGAGVAWRGLMVLGLTLALVAGWFDIYSLYRMYQFQDSESKFSQNS